MTDVAQACWEAVDEASTDRAILVGCSVGYATALHMAHQQPDRVSALIFSGASYRPVKHSAPRRIAQYEAGGLLFRRTHFYEVLGSEFGGSRLADYFADLFLEQNDTSDLPSIVAMYRAVGEPDPDWLFATVSAPTLIITGSEDNAHQAAFALRDRIPNARLETLDGAGHACQIEQPWEWDRHALAFLREHGVLPDWDELGTDISR
jgi:pimeloyl-ACP methyl ester carboxylesterase